MAVNVQNLRVQISDVPRWWPALSDPPDTIGLADGVRGVYGLRFPNFIESSLTIYFGTVPNPGPGPIAYVAQDASTYTISNVNQITFASTPTSGLIVGATYQATAFADADLSRYLANAQDLQSDDRSILKQAQFDLIDIIVADQDKMMLLKQGDFTRDPSKWVDSYLKLKEALRKDITGDPRPGKAIPAFMTGHSSYNRYGVGGGEVMR